MIRIIPDNTKIKFTALTWTDCLPLFIRFRQQNGKYIDFHECKIYFCGTYCFSTKTRRSIIEMFRP